MTDAPWMVLQLLPIALTAFVFCATLSLGKN